MKGVEFANSVDPDEVAHHEPPHLNPRCLRSSFLILDVKYFLGKFADVNFVFCIFGALKVELVHTESSVYFHA